MDDVTAKSGDASLNESVEAVNRRDRRTLYQKRVPIHPKAVTGAFRRVKWTFLLVLLGIYYVAPWIRWERGPSAPDQAILIDFPARRFYFFFIEIWPQEVYYLTGILILAAVGLFGATSLFGRVWCAWGCPQTVWTDLFMWVERLIEGGRNARIRLDRAPWTPGKAAKRALKHAAWLLIAALTGGAWVFYFADAPTLLREIVTLEAPAAAWITIAFLTATTYLLAGHAREQVCIYMCPYSRFQAAMLDEESLVVTYRSDRGEPRGSHKHGMSWEGRGHCVDCKQCIVVCPAGIDIRDGQQLECINCALCIDACDGVMDRFGLDRRLIAFDTLANVEARKRGDAPRLRIFRQRTFVYVGIILIVGGIMLAGLLFRSALDVNVLRDRNPLFVMLSDGGIRNGFTVKVLNKLHEFRSYRLRLEGIEGAGLRVVGVPGKMPRLTVKPDRLDSFRVYVKAPKGTLRSASTDVTFVLTDEKSGVEARRDAVFRGPER